MCDWEMAHSGIVVLAVEHVVAGVGEQDLTDTADAIAAVEHWDTEQREPGLLHSLGEEDIGTEAPKVRCRIDLLSAITFEDLLTIRLTIASKGCNEPGGGWRYICPCGGGC